MAVFIELRIDPPSEPQTLRSGPSGQNRIVTSKSSSSSLLRGFASVTTSAADASSSHRVDAQQLERRVGELERELLGSRNLVRLYGRKTALLGATSRVRRHVAAALYRENRHHEDRIRRLTASSIQCRARRPLPAGCTYSITSLPTEKKPSKVDRPLWTPCSRFMAVTVGQSALSRTVKAARERSTSHRADSEGATSRRTVEAVDKS
ncbi:hypothetical protein AYL99_11859 [Fonsecaea erecta]|uniref:Uncharacterized protein n=1 Tax=Fonsecaea erecta TaxID=1367422 RepID=A0A178Z2F4_9EURO|nr:hypothetical protein AYL99_11859 [Fonsecaea erecta]OAP53979.1 hypothetical protein AYL99_11859 [Fonsecaea erecta]